MTGKPRMQLSHDREDKITTYRTSVAISPRIAEQLFFLCEHHGESQSQIFRRLVIEAYSRLQEPGNHQ